MKRQKIKDSQQMKTESEKFFKEAFCIDGDAKQLSPDEMIERRLEIIGVMELNDSKRGRFYLAVLEEIK